MGALGALSLAGVASRAANSAAASRTRLIVRGDDMSYAHAGNVAVIKTWREGIQTTIDVIVAAPWFPEAARMLAENPELDVGVHLALTSEWDNIKWRPLTRCPSLVDEDGYFWPMVVPHPAYPGRSISENKWRIEEIEQELRAQIELCLRRIPRVSHATGHMGCFNLAPEVRALADRLVKEYNIDINLARFGVKRVRYAGPKGTLAEKTDSFIKMLDTLEPGSTYCFVEHPGLDTPEVRAISHIGYENVAADRQGVTDLWTSPRIKEEIERRGIELISYRDLKKDHA
ncbi:MAG: polysaccharide deacetylase family protein [Opitutaceae bacterium]